MMYDIEIDFVMLKIAKVNMKHLEHRAFQGVLHLENMESVTLIFI